MALKQLGQNFLRPSNCVATTFYLQLPGVDNNQHHHNVCFPCWHGLDSLLAATSGSYCLFEQGFQGYMPFLTPATFQSVRVALTTGAFYLARPNIVCQFV